MNSHLPEKNDLFNQFATLPEELKTIVAKYGERYIDGDMDYKDTEQFLKEVEAIGYTFEYYLDNEPYNLRKKMKTNTFKTSTKAPNGTSLHGEFRANYEQLRALFGEPEESDGYKVSTEWTLEDEEGNVVTLYDYKETELYDSDLPSVAEFRAFPEYDWHIGATSQPVADALKAFLTATLAGTDTSTPPPTPEPAPVFPNGFTSWIETHHEVVSHLANTSNFSGTMSNTRSEEQGTGGLYELGEELTNEFEKLHEGREWDGEFFDEIESFLKAKDKANAQKVRKSSK